MKQTAVEWLFNELLETPKDKFFWYSILEKAKQIEKEQIVKAFDDGCEDVNRIGIEYYQETYENINKQ